MLDRVGISHSHSQDEMGRWVVFNDESYSMGISLSLYIQDVQGWLVVFKMNCGSLTSVPRGRDGESWWRSLSPG